VKIINGDTSTVEYSIIIKNNDVDDLYVFDPDKAGTKIFHFYNNGPNLNDLNSSNSYSSQYKITENPAAWDSTWYTLVKSGESIARTISLRGYPDIPAGEYKIVMDYSCPKQISKIKRRNNAGRYWIGKIPVNDIYIKID
jgi:hypothetical protein